ncbi:hypothetical protein L195_g035802 [Trifolium pratense]|uniref:Uncharacterized protein n=1 Tax=Trifolium pratense TaxID=57577 RepID=A0A2K3LMR2_TRIPR|nr:hypothetical protein L195_g035802 [Trifolium pratense]
MLRNPDDPNQVPGYNYISYVWDSNTVTMMIPPLMCLLLMTYLLPCRRRKLIVSSLDNKKNTEMLRDAMENMCSSELRRTREELSNQSAETNIVTDKLDSTR